MAKSRGSRSGGLPGTMSYRGRSATGHNSYGTVKGQLTPKQWLALRAAQRKAAYVNRLMGGRRRRKSGLTKKEIQDQATLGAYAAARRRK